MFDTLTYANKLKEAGFTERQAQAQAEALVSIVDSNLATKHDIENLRHDTKLEIELLHRGLKEFEIKTEGQFILLKWMLGFVLAGILSLVLKIFTTH